MKIFIRADEQGYVREFSVSDIGNAEEVDVDDFDDFDLNYRSYKLVNNQLVKDENQQLKIEREYKQQEIREQREIECFPIVNRGGIWYELLTPQEKTELMEWYQAWLNATETLEIPIKPEWLK